MVPQAASNTALLDLRGSQLAVLNPEMPPWVERLTDIDEQALPLETPHGLLVVLSEDTSEANGLLFQLIYRRDPGGVVKINFLNTSYKRAVPEVTLESDGDGLTSKTLALKTPGIRYLVVSASHADALTTLLLSRTGKVKVAQALDARLGDDPVSVFQRHLVTRFAYEDQELFGRIRAELMADSERLSEEEILELEVALEEQPLLAAVSFRIKGVDPAKRVYVEVNGQGPVAAHYTLPDLADPGYVGKLRQSETAMSFQYLEPVVAKAILPGHLWRTGESNSIRIYLSEDHPDVDVSEVQLELKYPWEKFNYILEP